MSSEEELLVPEMIGFEILTKIIIGYLKVGADKEEKTYADVATVANVAQNNISINSKFLKSIGIIEGSTGRYKLTPNGIQYAQALDWGRLDEANRLLKEILKDRELTKRTIGYVDINKPVDKENLIGQIAMIAGVRKEQRFETGIRGFVDMLVTSGLLGEDADGKFVAGKIPKKEVEATPSKPSAEEPSYHISTPPFQQLEKQKTFPITLNFNISNDTDVENLKKILKAIREVLLEA